MGLVMSAALEGIGRGIDDGIGFVEIERPLVSSSSGWPRPFKTRPKKLRADFDVHRHRIGMTSEEGPIPFISPRGERITSSFVKPTTSAASGSSVSFDEADFSHFHLRDDGADEHADRLR